MWSGCSGQGWLPAPDPRWGVEGPASVLLPWVWFRGDPKSTSLDKGRPRKWGSVQKIYKNRWGCKNYIGSLVRVMFISKIKQVYLRGRFWGHFPCVLARSSRGFFAFAYVAKLVRMAGIKDSKPVRTLDPRSPLPLLGWWKEEVVCDYFPVLWYPGWSESLQKLFISSSRLRLSLEFRVKSESPGQMKQKGQSGKNWSLSPRPSSLLACAGIFWKESHFLDGLWTPWVCGLGWWWAHCNNPGRSFLAAYVSLASERGSIHLKEQR